MKFEQLGLSGPVLTALVAQNYSEPTPIQVQAIPPVLEGRDVVGLAQTGTGKTAAFALPLLQRLVGTCRKSRTRPIRVLIVSPTRELAAQITRAVRDFSRGQGLISACVVGGASIGVQRKTLSQGVDILVATPGRLLDLADQKALRLDGVEALVLDEADHMLDIGFLPAIKRIVSLVPRQRQTLLFSATMPKKIRELTGRYLTNPVEVAVAPVKKTADRIEQSVIHLPKTAKTRTLVNLAAKHAGGRMIVFTRTKHGADRVARALSKAGHAAAAIHGNKSQGQRARALEAFRKGKCLILIATDIAARGIDVPDVAVVVNFDLPNVPEVYVHRIGRTARAGSCGIAISLCAGEEADFLRDIERLIKIRVPVMTLPDGGDGTAPQIRTKAAPAYDPAAANTASPLAGEDQDGKSARRKPRRRWSRKTGPRRAGTGSSSSDKAGSNAGRSSPGNATPGSGKRKASASRRTRPQGKSQGPAKGRGAGSRGPGATARHSVAS